MSMPRHVARSAGIMMLFAFIFTALLTTTYQLTRPIISRNEEQTLLTTLNQVLPKALYNSDLLTDKQTKQHILLLGNEAESHIYPAFYNGKPIAVALEASANDGYSGKIKLLIGINLAGEIIGVRVISHKETPGLGDYIDSQKSEWIQILNGKSLNNPQDTGWKVKKDGGEFTHMAGATISPRAVIHATHQALLYYKQEQKNIFAPHYPRSKGKYEPN
jgi:Na+-translocating ferredoxin:NAD+ oxidoreductase subunit G